MSIATEITRLNNNIDSLKTIKQNIKTAVNNDFNKITNEKIEDYASKIKDTFELYKDQIPDTTTTKLTRIDIDDAMVYSKNKLNVFGRTEQKTLIGKNLCQTIYSGYYNVETGTLVANNAYRTFIAENIPAGNYVFSTDLNNCRILRIWKDNSNTNVSADRNTQLITTTQTGKVMVCVRNTSTTEITENVLGQIEGGSTPTDYEPYCGGTASPNPDYPQEIQNVEGRSCRNLIDVEEEFSFVKNKDIPCVLSAGDYIISFEDVMLDESVSYSLIQFRKAGQAIATAQITSSSKRKNVSLNNDIETIRIYSGQNASVSAGISATFKKMMIRNASISNSNYESYFEGKRLYFNICNKNLGGIEELYKDMVAFSPSYVKKEIVDGKDCIVFNNTVFRSERGFKAFIDKFTKNKRYRLDADVRVYDVSYTSGHSVSLGLYDENGSRIAYSTTAADGSNWHHSTIISKERYEYFAFCNYVWNCCTMVFN